VRRIFLTQVRFDPAPRISELGGRGAWSEL